jgi:hypothetical protein
MSSPYRESAAPDRKPRRGNDLGGTLMVLVLLALAFGAGFLVITWFFRLIGPNHFVSMILRLLVVLLGIAVCAMVALVLCSGRKGSGGMVLAVGLIGASIVVMFLVAGHRPALFFAVPRAGAMDLEPLGWWEMVLSGWLNLSFDLMVGTLLVMKPIHSDMELQKSRLVVANLEPCPRCHGRWEIEGDRKRCTGCGDEQAAPTKAEIQEIRGTTQ